MKSPKLTLRDLFYIVTLSAVLLAWWVDRSRLADRLASTNSNSAHTD